VNKPLPTNESSFYIRCRDETLSSLYWERVEPVTESGFPDAVVTDRKSGMDTQVELKFCKTRTPNLNTLMKPTQKASIIDYQRGGGRKRVVLVCSNKGVVFFYSTKAVVDYLTKNTEYATEVNHIEDSENSLLFRLWLPRILETIHGVRYV